MTFEELGRRLDDLIFEWKIRIIRKLRPKKYRRVPGGFYPDFLLDRALPNLMYTHFSKKPFPISGRAIEFRRYSDLERSAE